MKVISNNEEKTNTIINSLVFFGALLLVVLQNFLSTGNISSDSINYVLQAQKFWEYKINFPLGYPLLIKFFSHITGSLFIASKLINIISYLGIIYISYKKKFYFQHTILIFSFYPFIAFYSSTLSEPLFYFFNYLIIYTVYQIIKNGLQKKYIAILSILFFLLVSIRFSGLFVFVGTITFLVYLLQQKKYPLSSYFYLCASSTIGVILYLYINYLYCGYLLGQRSHLHNEVEDFIPFILQILKSTFHDFSFLNIIIHKGALRIVSPLNIWIGITLILFSICLFIKKTSTYFSLYLFITFAVLFLTMFYSYYTTIIDNTIRIKSNAYLYLLFYLLINSPKKLIIYFKWLTVIILIFNSLTLIRFSGNINNLVTHYEKLICNSNHKIVHIVYKNNDFEKNRNNAKLLLFKAILIDRNYIIIEEIENSSIKPFPCKIYASEIIK